MGILLLLIIINFIPIKEIKINEISDQYLNKQVKVQGLISNIKIHENNFTTFQIINKNNKIQAICNCPLIQINQEVELIGRISEYKNKLQIQVDKITILI